MLKDSKDLDQLDKLHRERTRWVVSSWVFGVLFALSFLGVLALGVYIAKPELAQKNNAGQIAQPTQALPQEANGTEEVAPKVAGVSIDDDPVQGAADAPVTVIEFSDFLCPYCAVSAGFREDLASQLKSRDAAWEAPVPKILETYVNTGKVKFVFRDCPFHGGPAVKAAEAADCANDQGKYWEMHDLLFTRQTDFPQDEGAIPSFLKQLAKDLGLNQSKFDQCLDQGKYTDEVNKDLEAAKSYGVNGTPTYFVNGRKLVGAQSFSSFQAIIEEELKGGE